jgi:flagellar M-ring protein FliF
MNAVVAPGYPRWAAGLRPVLLLVGIAAAVAAGVAVVLWSRGPNYSLLYANLATEDQAQITQALDAAGIPYRLAAGSNAIEVPSERVSEARLKLAGQGLPEGDGEFALMTKDSGFGVSQLMENARYQHALELELAHTIASLRPVDGARVHIAAPPDSAFVRDRRPASASVFVQLKPGRALSQEQVQAIVNLIASSVPNLQANQVTVVDQQGQLLSAPQGTDEFAQREEHFQQVHRLEDDYVQRIEELLTPLVGPGHVRAQVVASIDTSVSEEAREQYAPNSQIVRSEQLSEQTSRDGSATAQGVPGALSNQPPPAGVAQPPPAAAAASNASSSSSSATAGAAGSTGAGAAAGGTAAGGAAKPAGAAAAAQPPASVSTQSTRNYEIDRTLDYTRQPAGRLKRLTVAVLIDDIREVGKDGKPTERPMSSAELAHVTQLVKDAVGFDASRGDSVNVVNSSFQTEATPADTQLEEVPLWERPLFTELAKLGAGLIVLLVLSLAVLRPLVRGLIAPARAALAAPAPHSEPALAAPTAKAVAPSSATAAQPYEQQVSSARALVNQDPKRVAQVVRTWVAADE